MLEVTPSQTISCERADLVVFDDDIDVFGKLSDDVLSLWRRYIERDRFFSSVDAQKIRGIFGFLTVLIFEKRRTPGSGVVSAPRALDFDDFRAEIGAGVSALVTGTVFGLLYAYLSRFSAVAMQSVDAGYARVPLSVDESARMLGSGPLRLFVTLHLPLLRRSAFASALLVFVDTMKELPATLVLRPFGSDTLAVVAYNLARDERLAEAALPSLAIVAVGLLPVLMLSRAMRAGEG